MLHNMFYMTDGQLEPLSRGEVCKVHNATMELLEEVGVDFASREALDILDGAGARVDFKTTRVRFPTSLVEEMVRKAPSRFTWHGRNPKYDIKMERGKVHYGPAGTLVAVVDLETGERKPATRRDAEDLTRLMDALENVDEGYCLVQPQDVPDSTAHAYMMLAMAKNTEKPFRGRIFSRQVARDIFRMHAILAGGEDELKRNPNVYLHANPTSPLTFSKDQLEGLIEYASHCMPTGIAPQIQAGATGPVTLAGTLVQLNAEVLSGITLIELVNPGNPAVYGCISSVMDLRGGSFTYGAIELGLLMTGSAQMARFYNLPSRGGAGATDACLPDMQAGYEGALNLLLATLAGTNIVMYAAGALEQALTASFEKAVIDNEVVGMVKRAARGIKLDDDALAVDVIRAVGPGGHYMAEKHTREFYRREMFVPELASRVRWDSWIKSGAKDVRERAKEVVKKILKEHQPEPLDKTIEEDLKKIVKEVAQREQKNDSKKTVV